MRKFVVSVLILAMLLLGGTVFAQDPCAGLAEADCAILTASSEAMEGVTSASFNFTLNIQAEGESLTISGDGAFDVSGLMGVDASAFEGTDLTAIFDALGAVVQGFSGDLSISISAPASVGMPPIALELLLVDGVGYLNFGGVAVLLGGPETLTALGLPTEWAGLDLVDTVEQVVALAGPQLGELEEQLGDQMGSMDEMDMSQFETFAQYITFTRLDDEGSTAVFSGTIDLGGIFTDPAFLPLLEAQLAAQGTEMSEAEMAEVLNVLPALANAFELSLTQRINQSNYLLTSADFVFAADGAALAALGGGDVSDVTVSGSITLADHNAAPAIAAPAGAPVATFMQLLGLLGSLGGF
jgi:hypothetical protein